jgi:hypothetical protein
MEDWNIKSSQQPEFRKYAIFNSTPLPKQPFLDQSYHTGLIKANPLWEILRSPSLTVTDLSFPHLFSDSKSSLTVLGLREFILFNLRWRDIFFRLLSLNTDLVIYYQKITIPFKITRIYIKIGHQVGLGYKVPGSRFKVKRFALFSLRIDSIGLIPWGVNLWTVNLLTQLLGWKRRFLSKILHHNTL